jgi:hypothetical protein
MAVACPPPDDKCAALITGRFHAAVSCRERSEQIFSLTPAVRANTCRAVKKLLSYLLPVVACFTSGQSGNGAEQLEKFRCLVLLQHSAIVAHYETLAVLLAVEGRSVSHHPLLRQYLPGRRRSLP